MQNKTLWIFLTVMWVLAIIPTGSMALMSVMMFDAPGSYQSRLTWVLFDSVASLPVSFLIGAGVPWIFYKTRFGIWLFALPLVSVIAICVSVMLISQHCGGQFSCK